MTPRVLFIANAGPEVGGGHVMRSLTLAAALAVPTMRRSPTGVRPWSSTTWPTGPWAAP